MDITTLIDWEGSGWYAGSVERGVDRWIKIGTTDESVGTAIQVARHKGLGTPKHLASPDGFDKVNDVTTAGM